jgi:hypothetical protein
MTLLRFDPYFELALIPVKNVLNVEKTTHPSIFGLPPWPRTFRSAS